MHYHLKIWNWEILMRKKHVTFVFFGLSHLTQYDPF